MKVELKAPKEKTGILAPANENHSKDPLTLIGGGYYQDAEEGSDQYPIFCMVDIDAVNVLTDDEDPDRRKMHVLAATENKLRKKLESRYSSPPGASRLVRVFNYKLKQRKKHHYKDRYEWHEVTIPHGFVLLPKPVFFEVATVTALRKINGQYGRVFIDDTCFHHLFRDAKGAAAEKFLTSYDELLNICSVNYNPESFEMQAYRAARDLHEDRSAGEFPAEIRHALYTLLYPGNWPNAHPFKDEVRGKDTTEQYGWGNTRPVKFHPPQIMNCLKLTKKMWGEPWWRDIKSVRQVVIEALQYLHGVESRARWQLAEDVEQRRMYHRAYMERYRTQQETLATARDIVRFEDDGAWTVRSDDIEYARDLLGYPLYPREYVPVDGAVPQSIRFLLRNRQPRPAADLSQYDTIYDLPKDREDWETDPGPVPSTAEMRRIVQKEDRLECLDALALCRWLRAEARVLGLKLPRPSVKPLSPVEIRKKEKLQRKQRRERAKAKRTAKKLQGPGVVADQAAT